MSLIPDQNNIDSLLDQMDDATTNNCCQCLCNSNYLLKLSCDHSICLDCSNHLIESNSTTNCPQCRTILVKRIDVFFAEYMTNPIIKLAHYHKINIGDMVWAYKGNGHHWLYSKEHCDQIEGAFEQFDETDTSDGELDELEITININDQPEIYVIDFQAMEQYQKNAPHKRRGVFSFELKSKKDLTKNKIIGVAGSLL